MDYEYWCGLSDEELGQVDIAEVNLACAAGLPGSEELDVSLCLKRLEEWTDRVRAGIDRALRNRAKYPDYDELSEAEYCILTMFAVLYRHIKLEPNLDRDYHRKPYGRDSRDNFIHAVLSDLYPHLCCTASVLFTAIGRRIGYPIKLVKSREHIFCRRDDPKGERFNIEATDQGYYRRSDEHYRNWPKPSDPQSIHLGGWLRSMTPREELSVFLSLRGGCLLEHLQLGEAVKSLHFCCQADPHDHFHCNLWKIVTLIFRAQQNAPGADPRTWRIPSPRKHWEHHVHFSAIEEFNRILMNRQRDPKSSMPQLTFETIVSAF
jgi:hypothetical protein